MGAQHTMSSTSQSELSVSLATCDKKSRTNHILRCRSKIHENIKFTCFHRIKKDSTHTRTICTHYIMCTRMYITKLLYKTNIFDSTESYLCSVLTSSILNGVLSSLLSLCVCACMQKKDRDGGRGKGK